MWVTEEGIFAIYVEGNAGLTIYRCHADHRVAADLKFVAFCNHGVAGFTASSA